MENAPFFKTMNQDVIANLFRRLQAIVGFPENRKVAAFRTEN
jgi:hypothetical protein